MVVARIDAGNEEQLLKSFDTVFDFFKVQQESLIAFLNEDVEISRNLNSQ